MTSAREDCVGETVVRRPWRIVCAVLVAYPLAIALGVLVMLSVQSQHHLVPDWAKVDAQGNPAWSAMLPDIELGIAMGAVLATAWVLKAVWGGYTAATEPGGLRLRRLGEDRLVPYENVRGAALEGRKLVVSLSSGTAVRIVPSLRGSFDLGDMRKTILENAHRAREGYREPA